MSEEKCECWLCRNNLLNEKIIKKYNISQEDQAEIDGLELERIEASEKLSFEMYKVLECLEKNEKILYYVNRAYKIEDWPQNLTEQLQETGYYLDKHFSKEKRRK